MVRYQGHYHAVTGWLKATPDTDAAGGIASRRLLFATRVGATHVCIRNPETGPTVARLADIEPTGERALFAPNTIRAAHRMAAVLDGQPTDHYDPEPAEEDAVTETIDALRIVPDIGDTFQRPGFAGVFAVVGWLKGVPLEGPPSELAGLFADQPPSEPLLMFCVREDAEFVVGHGVCGVIAPVGEVEVTGRCGWPETHVEHARARAVSLVGEFAWTC